MRKIKILLFVITAGLLAMSVNWAVSDSNPTERERRAMVDYRVDNNGYWIKMAKKGLATLNPEVRVEEAIFTGSQINAVLSITDDSPDVPVTEENSTQSENSIFVDPSDEETVLNSNNSTTNPVSGFYGANDLYSFDAGETWDGEIYGAGGSNSGDPTTGIGTDGRWYVGYIANGGGQGVSYSDNKGETWTKVTVAPNPGQLADKNHMWIDNKVGSPYENYLYNAWTPFGTNQGKIVLSRSTDNGETWSNPVVISSGTGGFHQGVNLSTGPNGEVYAIWAVTYGGGDENAIGFAKSTDGGETWETAYTIIDGIRGIRASKVPQNMRVNSFPVMAVDFGDGSNSGNLYVTWTNIGTPGQNTGSDRRVYMIRSEDDGETWTEPIQVNQSENDNGYVSYFPWITCDPSNGLIAVVFYDNRNSGSTLTEAWCAVSYTTGDTWEDFKVSDVAFVPAPIPGTASGYMGDYLGITALNGWVYPCWTDNRSGHALTYVSPFQTIDIIAPTNLQADTDQETGECSLVWNYEEGTGFQYFNIYRNDEFIISTNDEFYTDMLTEYGYYTYKVTAYYGGENESLPTIDETQYGTATIVIDPVNYIANVYVEDSSIQYMTINNVGVLDLEFSLSPFFSMRSLNEYPPAKGGGDEYIHRVTLANLNNSSGGDQYADFTSMYANLQTGKSYTLNIEVKRPFNGDQCAAWVDWNQNGVFDETAIVLNPDETYTYFSASFTPPKGSAQGATRMRVRLAGPGGDLSPIDDTEYGDVEDYTILIADWLTLDPDEGIVPPGDSILVKVKFDATGLNIGTYEETAIFLSNDINNQAYYIDFTMNVTNLQITTTANPETICLGYESQLEVTPIGGSGSFTYSWTSDPEGFTSDEQNPVVIPEATITYYVSVDDGTIVLTDSVTVTVNELPQVALGDDLTLCGENEYELDAGNEGSTYLWSTDETTQQIMATGSGETQFWVQVTNESGCVDVDTISINFASTPEVNLGQDTIICHNESLEIDAGNPGSTYLWSTGETSQKITISAEEYEYGAYDFSCEVTNTDGCSNSSQINVEIKDCTGIDEFETGLGVDIYPNPNHGNFSLEINSTGNKTVNIKVVSVTGKLVYQVENITVNGSLTHQINLSNLVEGVYTVFVIGDGIVANKKVVLSK